MEAILNKKNLLIFWFLYIFDNDFYVIVQSMILDTLTESQSNLNWENLIL